MENKNILDKAILKISHLPTVMLMIGYVTFWIELYFIKRGHGLTSGLAWGLFILFFIFVIVCKIRMVVKSFLLFFENVRKEEKFTKYFLIISFGIVFLMLAIILRAYLLPLHLPQEYDALNYHYALPRQHLILSSFQHIKWSSADLFILPLDFALSPYWFMTELPNKFPQFCFLAGLVLVLTNLVKRFNKDAFVNVCLISLAVFGAHFIAIQMGTAMLDIVISYLFFAALDSFLAGAIYISLVEFSFFLWSKPFIPIQTVTIISIILLLFLFLKKLGFRDFKWIFDQPIDYTAKINYFKKSKNILIMIILCSVIIASPFLVKSTYYSGSPLFPFAAGAINIRDNADKNSEEWKSILASSKIYTSRGKDDFGYGRTLADFVRHLWLISVPEKGATNRYDYPVGLIYLLFLGPFLRMLFCSFKRKEIPVFPLVALAFWGTWWFGSQQTRFLYIPILIIMVIVLAGVKIQSKIFMSAVLISLFITGVSIFRAHGKDFWLSTTGVLREKDRKILEINKEYATSGRVDAVYLDYCDVAYAIFPVVVTKESLPWVLYTRK